MRAPRDYAPRSPAGAEGPRLSELREPRRDRRAGGRARRGMAAGRAIRTARRSIPDAARIDAGRRTRPPAQRRRALRAAARHGRRRGPRRRDHLERNRPSVRTARPVSIVLAPQVWGDVVLARKDAPTSYHLAVVVDDALQGVTDVVRGQDLFWATSVHRAAAGAARPARADLPSPPPHSRRRTAQAVEVDAGDGLRELRGRGATAADIRRMVGLGH